MKYFLRHALALAAVAGNMPAADLVAVGNWTEMLTAAHLVAGAGSNLPAQMESMAGVTTLTISNSPGGWSLRARLSTNNLPGGITIFVKRTSAGSGSGSISGGDTYVALTGNNVELFTGTEARGEIALKFKITGLSVQQPPATYLSSIIFTVQ